LIKKFLIQPIPKVNLKETRGRKKDRSSEISGGDFTLEQVLKAKEIA
jgi:hypothetical protein